MSKCFACESPIPDGVSQCPVCGLQVALCRNPACGDVIRPRRASVRSVASPSRALRPPGRTGRVRGPSGGRRRRLARAPRAPECVSGRTHRLSSRQPLGAEPGAEAAMGSYNQMLALFSDKAPGQGAEPAAPAEAVPSAEAGQGAAAAGQPSSFDQMLALFQDGGDAGPPPAAARAAAGPSRRCRRDDLPVHARRVPQPSWAGCQRPFPQVLLRAYREWASPEPVLRHGARRDGHARFGFGQPRRAGSRDEHRAGDVGGRGVRQVSPPSTGSAARGCAETDCRPTPWWA